MDAMCEVGAALVLGALLAVASSGRAFCMRWRPKMEYWLDKVADVPSTVLRLMPAAATLGTPAVRVAGILTRVLVA